MAVNFVRLGKHIINLEALVYVESEGPMVRIPLANGEWANLTPEESRLLLDQIEAEDLLQSQVNPSGMSEEVKALDAGPLWPKGKPPEES